MNDLVKNLGAELGAAKAEVERLREALRPFAAFEAVRSKQGGCTPKSGTVWAVSSISEEAEITVEHLQAAVSAISQQPEPSPTVIALSFVQPVPDHCDRIVWRERYYHLPLDTESEPAPAQDEQQPLIYINPMVVDEIEGKRKASPGGLTWSRKACCSWTFPLYAAPIAQTAPQGKFAMGDRVKKSTGSEWEGHICGTYSTEQTPEGYAVESSAHRNSVQIYPAKALEAVE